MSIIFTLCACSRIVNPNNSFSSIFSFSSINKSSADSSFQEFDLDVDYSQMSYDKLYSICKQYTYFPFMETLRALDYFRDGHVVSDFMSFKHKDEVVYFQRIHNGKDSYVKYWHKKYKPLTYSKALSLGFFGEHVKEKTKMMFFVRNDFEYKTCYAQTNDIYWRSSVTYDLTPDFMEDLGVWNTFLIRFDNRMMTNTKNFVQTMALPAIPIYLDDLSEICGVISFDLNGYARTYTKEDGCNKIIKNRQEAYEKMNNCYNNIEEFGSPVFYFQPGYPIISNRYEDIHWIYDYEEFEYLLEERYL